MKRHSSFVVGAILIAFCLVSHSAVAQPSWAKKASKSVFTLKTFTEDGIQQSESKGFFVSTDGEALGCYKPFRGASRAIVVDASGKEWEVEAVLGASETYDVARFKVGVKKSQSLTLSSERQLVGAPLWLLPYRETKNLPEGYVRRAETFKSQYDYLTLTMTMPENTAGAPLLNEAGEVVGVMQQPNVQGDSLSYAVSALFADSLKTTGLSLNDPVYQAIRMKVALPSDLNQALLSLFVANSLDSVRHAQLLEDFILQFPEEQDGYIARAQWAASYGDYGKADADMVQAAKIGKKVDEAHFSYARLIYQTLLTSTAMPFESWTFQKALQEAEEAYRVNPQPTYQYQQAAILYTMKRFDEAYAVYASLFDSNLRSAELFFEASQCKAQQNDTTAQLALLDSCMAQFTQPYLKEAAPFLLVRAQVRLDAQRYRDAVADLNAYEQLMKTQLVDNFYYIRYQAEVGGRLYQQALNDIDQAISMNPKNEFYYAEKASLLVRVGLYDEAIATAESLLELVPSDSNGYLFKGLALCLKGDKAEGIKNLRKAKELGDPQADTLIEKYQ